MVESESQQIPQDGATVDLSEHGARIVAEAPLTPGQTLSLFQADDPERALRCRVVWTGDVGSDGHDQTGLEFLDSRSENTEN